MVERDDFVADVADDNPDNRERAMRRISDAMMGWATSQQVRHAPCLPAMIAILKSDSSLPAVH